MAQEVAQGVLVIDKPPGWTSHDVVAKLRNLLRVKKVGHTGTLDPMATGVLVVCFGKATKIIPYLQESQKEYLADIHLGISTDTFDTEGKVIRKCQTPPVPRPALDQVCKRFMGAFEQIPPMFSAVKVGGKRLYRLARTGQTVERPPKKVTVFELQVMDYSFPRLVVRVLCSKGTYIRSLANDIGEALGCGGHLTALRRLRSGRFGIGDALTLECIAEAVQAGRLASYVMPLYKVLDHYPACQLVSEDIRKFRFGVPVLVKQPLNLRGLVRVFDRENTFYGLGNVGDDELRPVRLFL